MTTAKEATISEIRDILLRIERILTREADNATVEFYRKLLEDKAKEKRSLTPWPTVPAENWSLEAVHPVCRKCIGKPCGNTACPSRPVITCGSPTVTASTAPGSMVSTASTAFPPGTYVTPTAALPGMPDPPLPKVQTTWKGSLGEAMLDEPKLTEPVNPVNSSNSPRTWMHGGWIHATGFSMVGP